MGQLLSPTLWRNYLMKQLVSFTLHVRVEYVWVYLILQSKRAPTCSLTNNNSFFCLLWSGAAAWEAHGRLAPKTCDCDHYCFLNCSLSVEGPNTETLFLIFLLSGLVSPTSTQRRETGFDCKYLARGLGRLLSTVCAALCAWRGGEDKTKCGEF